MSLDLEIWAFPVALALLGNDRLNELVEHLVEALREELKQYGEMLALLDHQRKLVVPRHGPELLQSISALREQTNAIHIAREEREQRRRHLTRTLKLDEGAGFDVLMPQLPSVYRPLVEALVQENQELLRRARQQARENRLLLKHAIELMDRFVAGMGRLSNPGDSQEMSAAGHGLDPIS